MANWEAHPSYLREYAYETPGSPDLGLQLNSCSNLELPQSLKCSGRGRCVEWFDAFDPAAASEDFAANGTAAWPSGGLSFCECDSHWAGPECATPRKSQVVAFLLSMFLGFLGADQFYLGFPLAGVLKLLSLGGFGAWWLYDLVRIGSTPVETAAHFRLAANVHHWAFVLAVLCYMGFIGFALSLWSIDRHRVKQAREVLLLRAEASRPLAEGGPPPMPGPAWASRGGAGTTPFQGYGTTLGGTAVGGSRRLVTRV